MSLLLLGAAKAEVQRWYCSMGNSNRTKEKKINREKRDVVLEEAERFGGVVRFTVEWWCGRKGIDVDCGG